jgi:uncharacterized protein YecT (DUF1311 family)
MRISLALIIALSLAGQASGVSYAADECGSATNQSDMNLCFERVFARTDAELNAAYAKVLKSNSDDEKGIALLRAAEHAWIDFRDRNCAFETHSDEGGSIYRTVMAACQIRMTKARIKQLQSPDEE